MHDIGIPVGQPVGGGEIFVVLTGQGGLEDGVVVEASPVDDVGSRRREQGDVNDDFLAVTAAKTNVTVVGAIVGVVPAAALKEDLVWLYQARGDDDLHKSMNAFVVRPDECVAARAAVQVMRIVAGAQSDGACVRATAMDELAIASRNLGDDEVVP